MPVSNQRQVFQTRDLIFLSSNTEKGAGDLFILRDGCRSDGLRKSRIGLSIG